MIAICPECKRIDRFNFCFECDQQTEFIDYLDGLENVLFEIADLERVIGYQETSIYLLKQRLEDAISRRNSQAIDAISLKRRRNEPTKR